MQINPIDQLLNEFVIKLKNSPQLEKLLQLEMENLVRKIHINSIASSDGYCTKLKVPESDFLALLIKLDIDIEKMQQIFITTWNVPSTAHMVTNPYYHGLCFITLYGVRYNNEILQKHAMTLLLSKIWNGRLAKLIPFCDADVMRYVVANLTGKYTFRKYDGPLDMILRYFVPGMLKKYGPMIKEDSKLTKKLLDQSWGRIRQLFLQQGGPSLATGGYEARAGINPLYYDAHKKNLRISKPKISSGAGGDDNIPAGVDFYSGGEYDEIIDNLVNYIVVNIQPNYDNKFVEFIKNDSTVNLIIIKSVLTNLHNVKYSDEIRDLLELMFRQLKLQDINEVCKPNFISDVIKRKIISSKHAVTIIELKDAADRILTKIFTDYIKIVPYSTYSSPRKGHIRKVIFYGLAYNMQKFLCSGGHNGF